MGDPPETPRRNLTSAVVPAVAAAALAALVALLLVSRNQEPTKVAQAGPPSRDCITEVGDRIGGPISLVDSNGQTITQADFAGEPTIVYFGFANCPDICPTAMYTLADALAAGGGRDIQSVLITVDPARDTPEVLGQYVRSGGFPPGLVGLTGTQAQIDAAKDAFTAYGAKAPIEGAPDNVYNMDHSTFFYVMDGEWRTRSIIRSNGTTPEALAACIAAGLDGI